MAGDDDWRIMAPRGERGEQPSPASRTDQPVRDICLIAGR
jgi:hypothetical protein